MSITPVTREEKILSGADIRPRTRMEYFLKKASENGGGSESGLPKILESNLQLLTMFQERLEAEIPYAISNDVGVPKYHPASGVAASDEDAWDTMLADIENAFNNNTIPLLKMDNLILQPTKLQYTPEKDVIKAIISGIRLSYKVPIESVDYVFNVDFSVYLMTNNNLSGRKEYGLESIVELIYYQSGGLGN